MNEEINNNENKSKKKINKSAKFVDEPEIYNKVNEISKRKAFKKKTLKRITLDPPDELGLDDPENEKMNLKPEELSRSLIFEKGDITSRSLAFDRQVKVKYKKSNLSHSHNKLINLKDKKE